ncbi:hypothetical protein PIROE2DRAFT_18523 [Piromyces sp. E2]|nr:hypothetical protein PIROE2DRAFT_18523 [Piromyces sp. E2]|eukprot:OUM56737.1 hypothetical protein PIROE2DRAFT_18523 [Piromyces sp. E2]
MLINSIGDIQKFLVDLKIPKRNPVDYPNYSVGISSNIISSKTRSYKKINH